MGAGGWFVRNNGRIYEHLKARRERRTPLEIYHTVLKIRVPEGNYVIENAWPIPDRHGAARGVVVEGPVFSRRLERFRTLRYEIRRWRDGIIYDEPWALPGDRIVTQDLATARRILALVPHVPAHVWGRDENGAGEMWNSNSVIAWLLQKSGLAISDLRPPQGGRAPGWDAGLAVGSARYRPR